MLEINKIYLGCCLEIMKEIDDKSIDLILCDLPYQVTARNSWDTIIPFDKLWARYERIIKDNGAVVLTATQPFASQLVCFNLKLFKYEWIWQKSYITGVLNAKKQPVRNHEQILVFYKSQPTYNPQGLIPFNKTIRQGTSSSNYGIRNSNNEYFQENTNYPRTVQLISSKGEVKKIHPTQKPLELGEYLVKTYTNENDLVLDNATGSGTFCLAAQKLKRNFIGIEKNENFYNIIKKKIEDINFCDICKDWTNHTSSNCGDNKGN